LYFQFFFSFVIKILAIKKTIDSNSSGNSSAKSEIVVRIQSEFDWQQKKSKLLIYVEIVVFYPL
jgi:hypothetical protein